LILSGLPIFFLLAHFQSSQFFNKEEINYDGYQHLDSKEANAPSWVSFNEPCGQIGEPEADNLRPKYDPAIRNGLTDRERQLH